MRWAIALIGAVADGERVSEKGSFVNQRERTASHAGYRPSSAGYRLLQPWVLLTVVHLTAAVLALQWLTVCLTKTGQDFW